MIKFPLFAARLTRGFDISALNGLISRQSPLITGDESRQLEIVRRCLWETVLPRKHRLLNASSGIRRV